MSFSLRKDPRKRRGGFALIDLPAGASGASAVRIERLEDGQSLGSAGWQAGAHDFGPYPVEESGNGPAIRVGPEIVNKMEVYERIVLSLPGLNLRQELEWPDEIIPDPGAAELGGIGAAPSTGGGLTQAAAPEPPKPEPTPEPAPAPAKPAPPEPTPPAPEKPDAKPKSPVLWIVLALLVALGAGGAWWFLNQEPAETAELTCARDDLVALLRADPPAGADRLWSAVETCRAAGDADLEMRVMEALVSREDGRALLSFGGFYDPLAAGPRPFGEPDAGSALQYYKRAEAAGAGEAAGKREALCTSLRGASDAISRSLLAIHCE